ncbi:MAG: hypothetical protein NC204_05320 [Candidatus Amulumruptor caecigallinarius]|nr:hypothetical protein [Candidatus Amulumruptor caecigallinarius]
MNNRYFIFAILLMFSLIPVSASEISQADSAYAKGEYAECIELYKRVESESGVSSNMLANMATAYAKSGDYGHAMLNYMRALRLDPDNSVARNNMAYVESRVADNNRAELKGKRISVEPESPTFFQSLKIYLLCRHTSNMWAGVAAVCFVAFIVCLGLYIFTTNVVIRKIGFFGGAILLGMSVITLLLAFAASREAAGQSEGVVTGYKITLKEEPSAVSKATSTILSRGTVMQVLASSPQESQKPNWYKVRLNSDFIGWIPASEFEVI